MACVSWFGRDAESQAVHSGRKNDRKRRIDDSLIKALMENFGNEGDCPCCCHHEEAVECVNEHSESGCCVDSEYAEIASAVRTPANEKFIF